MEGQTKVLAVLIAILLIIVVGLGISIEIRERSNNKKLENMHEQERQSKIDQATELKKLAKKFTKKLDEKDLLIQASESRSDSLLNLYLHNRKQKRKQHEIVNSFNDTTRGNELDRISARHDL